jgi:hypothetical protein
MTENRENGVSENFAAELRSFFVLCILSLVFAAMLMAFGIQFIVTAVLELTRAGTFELFPLVQVLVGWAAAAVGIRWILSSAKILKGVTKIRREHRAMEGPVSPEALTGLILRMMAHYRENWKAIWRMNLICTLGGTVFLALGVLNLIQGISMGMSAGGRGFLFLSLLAAAGINLTIGLVSLLFSSWFRRYARAWDHRLIEASNSGEALKLAMEQG